MSERDSGASTSTTLDKYNVHFDFQADEKAVVAFSGGVAGAIGGMLVFITTNGDELAQQQASEVQAAGSPTAAPLGNFSHEGPSMQLFAGEMAGGFLVGGVAMLGLVYAGKRFLHERFRKEVNRENYAEEGIRQFESLLERTAPIDPTGKSS